MFYCLCTGHGSWVFPAEDRSCRIWTFRLKLACQKPWHQPKRRILHVDYVILHFPVCVFVTCSGQFLVEKIVKEGAALGLTLGFVWNRNPDKLKGLIPDQLILKDLSQFADRCAFTQLRTHTHTNALKYIHTHIYELTSLCDTMFPLCTICLMMLNVG